MNSFLISSSRAFKIVGFLLIMGTLWTCRNQKPAETVIKVNPELDPPVSSSPLPAVVGELKTWHRISFDFTGPDLTEQGDPNPFTDFWMEIEFSMDGRSITVPGFFAADGNAGETSSESGKIWRAYFRPLKAGNWSYKVRFRQGKGIVFEDQPEIFGEAFAFDGASGTLGISPGDKQKPDLRARGLLAYTGERYLKFLGDESYFIKAGADSPENLLAYQEMDGTYNGGGKDYTKTWSAHIQDWQEGDPSWQKGKGKGLIGAVNYLASEEMNAFSFLTMNVTGDGNDVWPWIGPEERFRFDVSKLAQWEILFDHAEKKGMYLHFKTQETENDQLLDGGDLGPERKLYYRELIARFGHHLALNWNIGEENTQTARQVKDCAAYLKQLDPYDHPIVIHSYPNQQERVYSPLLGDASRLTGASLQCGWKRVHEETLKWIQASQQAGKPWVVANDEQNDPNTGVSPDTDWPGFTKKDNHDRIRRYVLWGNLMAGGAGVEYYFGYQNPDNDLNCQDWRSRDAMWDYNRYALHFFNSYIPFEEMESMDAICANEGDYALGKQGEVYALYLAEAKNAQFDLGTDTGSWFVDWYNPRKGGKLLQTEISVISGPGMIPLGPAPSGNESDWIVLIRKK